jgi:hypothetical protein
MWGAIWRGAISLGAGYLFALVVEKTLGVLLPVMRAAPQSDGSTLIAAAETVQSNFLLLVIIGIGLTLLGRAHLESRLGGV